MCTYPGRRMIVGFPTKMPPLSPRVENSFARGYFLSATGKIFLRQEKYSGIFWGKQQSLFFNRDGLFPPKFPHFTPASKKSPCEEIFLCATRFFSTRRENIFAMRKSSRAKNNLAGIILGETNDHASSWKMPDRGF